MLWMDSNHKVTETENVNSEWGNTASLTQSGNKDLTDHAGWKLFVTSIVHIKDIMETHI